MKSNRRSPNPTKPEQIPGGDSKKKSKKKAVIASCISVAAAAAIVCGIIFIPGLKDSPYNSKTWQEAYYKIVKEQVDAADFENGRELQIALEDLDDNSVPELIFKNENVGGLYTFGNGGLKKFEGNAGGKNNYTAFENDIGTNGEIYKITEDGKEKAVIKKSYGTPDIPEEIFVVSVDDEKFCAEKTLYGKFAESEQELAKNDSNFSPDKESNDYLIDGEKSSYNEVAKKKDEIESKKDEFDTIKIKNDKDADKLYEEVFGQKDEQSVVSDAESSANSDADLSSKVLESSSADQVSVQPEPSKVLSPEEISSSKRIGIWGGPVNLTEDLYTGSEDEQFLASLLGSINVDVYLQFTEDKTYYMDVDTEELRSIIKSGAAGVTGFIFGDDTDDIVSYLVDVLFEDEFQSCFAHEGQYYINSDGTVSIGNEYGKFENCMYFNGDTLVLQESDYSSVNFYKVR